MGKFSRNREYTFASLEEMITDIVEHFDEGMDIDIVLTWEETQNFITALISTGKFIPYDIEYAYPEVNGYSKEYQIALMKSDIGNIMFVEPIWCEKNGKYLNGDPACVDISFISMDVSKELYDKYVKDGYNIVLFDID